jgi:Uncharacterized protein conserved in bacteria
MALSDALKLKIKRILVQLALILGILVVLFILIQWGLKGFTRHGQALEVPDFTGLTMDQAREAAELGQLELEVVDSLYLPHRTRGTIFRQLPLPGERVKKHRRVLLTVNSMLPRKVNAPSLVGFSLRQAKAELASQGFLLGELSYIEDIATNTVLEQHYRGQTLEPGTPIDSQSIIDFVLGLNPENNIAYIPHLIGLNIDAAKDIITDHSLNVGAIFFDQTVLSSSDSLSAVVYQQTPTPTDSLSWEIGSRVSLFLSMNPPPPSADSLGRKPLK